MIKTLNILNKCVAHQTEDEGMGNQQLKEARKMGPREPEKSNWFKSGHNVSVT